MKIEELERWLVFDARDIDLGKRYEGANKKGKRPFLVVDFYAMEKIIKVRSFSSIKNDFDSERLLIIEELPESVLNPWNNVIEISFDNFKHATYNTRISEKSIEEINNFFRKHKKFLSL